MAGGLRPAQAARLAAAIRAVLEEAIGAGGSSLRDYVQASGELGFFQDRFAVYGRAGLPCPCCRRPVAEARAGAAHDLLVQPLPALRWPNRVWTPICRLAY